MSRADELPIFDPSKEDLGDIPVTYANPAARIIREVEAEAAKYKHCWELAEERYRRKNKSGCVCEIDDDELISVCGFHKGELEVRDESIKVLEAKESERQASFDLRYAATMRGIKLWQEHNPGKDLTWPDHGDLVFHLLTYIEGLDKICNGLIANKNTIIDRLEERLNEQN